MPTSAPAGFRRRWRVPVQVKLDALREAAEEGLTLSDWVRAVLAEWVAEPLLPQPWRVPRESQTLVLPPDARKALMRLAAAKDQRRLNVWLAMLVDARWPVTTSVASVLGVSKQAVSKRVGLGRQLLSDDNTPGLARLLAGLPEVPRAPEWRTPSPVGVPLVALSVLLPAELDSAVRERAHREGLALNQAMVAAITRALRLSGEDWEHPLMALANARGPGEDGS